MTTTISPVTEASLKWEFESAIRSEYHSMQHYRRRRNYADRERRERYAAYVLAHRDLLFSLLDIRRRARQ